jgi:hypothetical protein
MREAIMSGNWHFTSIKDLKAAITAAREQAEDQARQQWTFPCFFARGMNLATSDHQGGQCSPRVAAECPVWRRTWKEVTKLVADVEANHPHVMEVYIEGGYDGADSIHARWVDGDYQPWVGSWFVTIWERARKPAGAVEAVPT